MCWKCQEIDKKIDHYNKLRSQIPDKQTVEGIDSLVAQLKAEKLALHREGPPTTT